ncbi:UNVERIFIED_CONTAM: hypothetical protein Slati_2704600 [Sesamum latifolium]|uniref:Reverse transcriptase zinc-binding domain-containing protein n=1 Tax=Sesamum latifolium TaxID=2727402 RepID=A0AAW2VXC6_9LAMI
MFAWRAFRDSLPTSSKLERRGVSKGGACPWCGVEGEDLLHLLLRCHFAPLVWTLSHLSWSLIFVPQSDPEIWFHGLHRNLHALGFSRALLISWCLCGARNRLLFENVSVSAQRILERVQSMEGNLLPGAQAILELEGALKAY